MQQLAFPPGASKQKQQHLTMSEDNGRRQDEEITGDNSNRLVRAKTYRHGWNNDLHALSKFVKEQVFYVVVHDFKNESDDPLDVNRGAICQNLYLKRFPSKVTNVHMKSATKEEMTVYLKDLWTTALNTKGKGNIRRELSSEKSAVYSALNEAFRSKCIVVLYHVFDVFITLTSIGRISFELYREEYSDTSV
jgi:hypothetical protein